jgi:PRTRC genetic system protein A
MDDKMKDAMNMANFPVIIAKHSQCIEPAAAFGQRYIVGKRGLFREVNTPWLLSRVLIAAPLMPTPYGDVEEVSVFKCGSPPSTLWTEFIEHAKEKAPVECAGLMIWNVESKCWRLAIREESLATSSRVDYLEPSLDDDEIAVLDVHSHGHHRASFSSRDNADDQGCIKISAVIGRIDQGTPEVEIRLVCIDSIRKVMMDRAQLSTVLEAA